MNFKGVSLCLVFVLIHFALTNTKIYRCSDDMIELMKPLVLTKLIEDGNIVEAQKRAFVQLEDFKNIISYSGYFQVNRKQDCNLFFWYFPSMSNPVDDPVILWLQGGPGTTSIVSAFSESGPFEMKSKFELRFKQFTWIKQYSVIYIDNPVGTGYSFSSHNFYAENQTVISKQLYDAVKQFFKLFPKASKNHFYIAGEGYGAKFAIKLAELIREKNLIKKKHKIRLKGLIIGSAFCDPINQMDFGNNLHSSGLIDPADRDKFIYLENCTRQYILNGEYDKAYETFDGLINGDRRNGTLFQNITGLDNYYNYLLETGAHDHLPLIDYYVNLDDVRIALHVGRADFSITSQIVEDHLKYDYMQSVADSIPELLAHYKMLFYSAQLDVIVSYTTVEDFLHKLNYTDISSYANVTRCIWRVEDAVAGYAKSWGNLTHVLVRNAGHRVPADQPKATYDMVQRFINNIDFCT